MVAKNDSYMEGQIKCGCQKWIDEGKKNFFGLKATAFLPLNVKK